MDDSSPAVGPLEAAVLHVLWTRGPASASEVVAALPPTRRRHVNTIGTVLVRLARRGIVSGPVRTEGVRGGRYAAAVTREELARRCVAAVRRELFGGSLRGLLAALVPSATEPTSGRAPGRGRGKRGVPGRETACGEGGGTAPAAPAGETLSESDRDLLRRALRSLDDVPPVPRRKPPRGA